MSIAGSSLRLTGEGSGGGIQGLSLVVNSSLVLGFNCAPLASGKSNTFLGYGAAERCRVGSFNTVLGYAAGALNNGDNNVMIGLQSGGGSVFSSGNVFVGVQAGQTCTEGGNNMVVGNFADVLSGDSLNCLALGNFARAGNRDALAIGTEAIARGRQAVALGARATAQGDGHFNLADRVTGAFLGNAAAQAGLDTYVVRVGADVLQLAGAAMALSEAGSNADPRWQLGLSGTPTVNPRDGKEYVDLVLRSRNHTAVRFTDEFAPGVLDFTGQHRCAWSGSLPAGRGGGDSLVGSIVSSTGRYIGLDGVVGVVRADEAVPEVELSTHVEDPRVFGVISGFEDPEDACRTFALGSMRLCAPRPPGAGSRPWVVVNGSGEGALRVCDLGGVAMRNGDLIVASDLPGHGMLQQGPAIVRACTVAKITCDCDFDNPQSILRTTGHPVRWASLRAADGSVKRVRTALVGCSYRC